MTHRGIEPGAEFGANGMEREQFGSGAKPTSDTSAWPGPKLWDPENGPENPDPDGEHREAMAENPACKPCQWGWGINAPGPPHKPSTAGHRPHCSMGCCW